jgi:pimeloyl-ACP methyl ester carboxylesterase
VTASGHRTQVIRTSRGEVEYSDQGHGEPILFFHGGQGNAQNTTFDQVFDLTTNRLIIPSRPGYGGTEITGNETAAASAQMIAELVDEIGSGPVIAIGVSLGGRPAVEFAAQFPDKTRALILESAITGPWLSATDKRYKRSKLVFGPRYERYVWSATRLAFRMFPDTAARKFVNNISTMIIEGVDRDDAAMLRERINSLRSYSGLAADLDHTLDDEVLERVKCPTLLQYSNNDAMVDMTHARRAEELIPKAKLRLYDNEFGHFLWLGPGSDKVIADLKSFVANLDAELLAAE